MKAIISRVKYHYLPLLFLVCIVVLVFYFGWARRDAITFITQASGYISILIISISLMVGPMNIMLNRKNPVSTYFRRDISITGGVLAIIHSVAGLFVHLRGNNWQYFLTMTDHRYSIRLDNFGLANYSGLISALIIILLLLTSNDYFLKKLNQTNWKNIQRFSYLMFILGIIHCILYRIVKENLSFIYSFYLPLFTIVLTFQLTGAWLTRRHTSSHR